MRFSQRIGITPVGKAVQRDAIDNDLRNSLWSLLTIYYWDKYKAPSSGYYGRGGCLRRSNLEPLAISLWLHHFKQPIDTIDEYWEYWLKRVRDYFFSAQWHQVYDFIEFVAEYGPSETKDNFIGTCNSYLERENSAWRFINGSLAEITSEQEIEEIEKAMSNATPFGGVKVHLSAALSLLSDRKKPDYRNSIKESISAVESLAKNLSQDESVTLGVLLKEMERSKKLHPALKNAFSSLYGYTSDSDGIRHALMQEANLTKADARFMLICCSAFVNYVIEAVAAK